MNAQSSRAHPSIRIHCALDWGWAQCDRTPTAMDPIVPCRHRSISGLTGRAHPNHHHHTEHTATAHDGPAHRVRARRRPPTPLRSTTGQRHTPVHHIIIMRPGRIALLGGVLALLAVRAGGHASSTFQYCTKNLVRRPLVHGCPMNVNHHHRSINQSTGPWLTGLNSTRSNSKRIRPHRSPAWS